mmetsp:Transcript_20501/g.42019  ORF Transcript_20501/g.42019 Transcript_20501/m.42019 type:complete len:736 (-) Transcript_20501:47-2254(-)
MCVIILENLNHSHPRTGLVVHLGLATEGKDLLLLVHSIHHVRDGHGVHPSIGIDGHQETDHVGLQVQIHHGTLHGGVQLGQLTAVVDAVVVPHGDELRITLTTVTGLGGRRGFGRKTALHHNDVLQELVALLEDAVIHSGAVLGVGDSDTIVLERVVFELVDVKSQNVGQVLWGRQVLSVTSHEAIGHHEQHLVLVGVGGVQHGLDRFAQLVVSLVITRDHDHHGTPHVLLGVRPIPRTYINHRRQKLNDHQSGHRYKHCIHHDIEDVAERVELVVQQTNVELLFQTIDVLRGTKQSFVQIGGVGIQRVHDDLVQSRGQVGSRVVVNGVLFPIHGRLLAVVNAIDVSGHIVNAIVNPNPLDALRVQTWRRVGQQTALEVSQELINSLSSSREIVTGDAQEHIQVGKTGTSGVGEVVLGALDIQVVGLHFLHVQTLLGQHHGRSSGENLGGVFTKKVHNSFDPTGMAINQIFHVVNHAVYHQPILARLKPNILHAENSVLLAQQERHETEHTHEENRARSHDQEKRHLLTPRLLGVFRGPHDALVGDWKRDDPREGAPETTFHCGIAIALELGLGHRRRRQRAPRHDGGLGPERLAGPRVLGLGHQGGRSGNGPGARFKSAAAKLRHVVAGPGSVVVARGRRRHAANVGVHHGVGHDQLLLAVHRRVVAVHRGILVVHGGVLARVHLGVVGAAHVRSAVHGVVAARALIDVGHVVHGPIHWMRCWRHDVSILRCTC